MGIMLILIAICLVCFLIAHGIDSWGKKKMGEKGWEDFQKATQEEANKRKYNNYMFTCPMCGSKKVLKISTANRTASVAMFGVASDKIGKQYECDNCNHKW